LPQAEESKYAGKGKGTEVSGGSSDRKTDLKMSVRTGGAGPDRLAGHNRGLKEEYGEKRRKTWEKPYGMVLLT